MFALKVHETADGVIVAACDKAVLGETFTEDEIQLHVEESFYHDTDATLDEVLAALDGAATTNFVGEELVAALVAEDVIGEDEIRHVDGVPHAQLFFL